MKKGMPTPGTQVSHISFAIFLYKLRLLVGQSGLSERRDKGRHPMSVGSGLLFLDVSYFSTRQRQL
jgi:hypothetical protein